MAPILAEAEAACRGVGARTTRIDVGTKGGLALARGFGVVGTPTFVLIGEDNREHGRLVGEQPALEVESAIETAFGMRCQADAPKPSTSG
jgi:protein-disulfide isomerase